MNYKNDPRARLLLRLMHNLSEEHRCAQWMTGCEYALWADLMRKPVNGEKPWELSEDEREELRALQELAGGWFMWFEEKRDAVFLTTDEWLTHLALQEEKVQ